jgi:hypothetical protein
MAAAPGDSQRVGEIRELLLDIVADEGGLLRSITDQPLLSFLPAGRQDDPLKSITSH